jgi:hypothetical protein
MICASADKGVRCRGVCFTCNSCACGCVCLLRRRRAIPLEVSKLDVGNLDFLSLRAFEDGGGAEISGVCYKVEEMVRNEDGTISLSLKVKA